MSTHFLFQMKSPQFRFLCRWHFPNFWSFPFLSFGHFWRQLYLFWKVIFNGVPASVQLSSMITALSYKKASVCSAPNSSALWHPDMLLIFFPTTLGGEKKRDSPPFKIKLQSCVACSYLVEPSKFFRSCLRGKEGPGCYLLEENGNQAFSVYMRHIWPHAIFLFLSPSYFQYENSLKNAMFIFILFSIFSSCNYLHY